MTQTNFKDLLGWEKRSFDILVSQAVNLAVESLASSSPDMELSLVAERAKVFFKLLLTLRNDAKIQELYAQQKPDSPQQEEIPL